MKGELATEIMAPRKSALVAAAIAGLAGLSEAIYINESAGIIAPCDSPIYCYGELLKAIELASPFEDSKTFVDLYVFSLLLHGACSAKTG